MIAVEILKEKTRSYWDLARILLITNMEVVAYIIETELLLTSKWKLLLTTVAS